MLNELQLAEGLGVCIFRALGCVSALFSCAPEGSAKGGRSEEETLEGFVFARALRRLCLCAAANLLASGERAKTQCHDCALDSGQMCAGVQMKRAIKELLLGERAQLQSVRKSTSLSLSLSLALP